MTRGIAFGALAMAGVLAMGVAGYQGQPAAQKSVRLRTLGPGDDLYLLLGGGGNTLAMTRDDGTVLIDTKEPGWGHAIADAVNSATDRPVTTIINTNPQIDHVGGNVEFPSATEIIAHVNAKARMQTMPTFAGPNAKFLPNKTVTDRATLFSGRDQIDLYYFGAGHTDGDLIVVFPEKRIANFGDLFPSKAAPTIDVANGGSGVSFPQTLARAVAEIKGINRVITGHEEGVVARRDPRAAIGRHFHAEDDDVGGRPGIRRLQS